MTETVKNKFDKKRIISWIIYALVIVVVAYVIISVIVSKVQNKPTMVFGLGFSVVVSESMEPEIKVGDMIVYQKASFEDFKVGDFIVFKWQINGQDATFVHEVVEIDETNRTITAKGTSPVIAADDTQTVTEDRIYGKTVFYSPVFTLTNLIFAVILIIFLIVIGYIIARIVRLNKQRQKEDEDAIRAKIIAEYSAKNSTEKDDSDLDESHIDSENKDK